MKLEAAYNVNNKEGLLRSKAQHCSTCRDWLKECNAECCRLVSFGTNILVVKESQDYVKVNKPCSRDMIWYYKLRGVKYAHGTLYFPKKRFIILDGVCVYVQKCELLDENNLCKGHPDDKPEFCKDFNVDTIIDNKVKSKRIYVTPNCLFKFKAMEYDER